MKWKKSDKYAMEVTSDTGEVDAVLKEKGDLLKIEIVNRGKRIATATIKMTPRRLAPWSSVLLPDR